MNSAQRQATYEDLLKVPDILIAEIIDGELITSPRPAIPYSHASGAILGELSPFDRGFGEARNRGDWWMLLAPELHLGTDILVPDLAGWRRERLPVLRDVPYFEQAPDWLCEITSPSTGRLDRVRKIPVYARERVEHIWLVDPLQRTLEVYRLEGQRWMVVSTYGGEESIHAEPFAALELDMSRW